MRKLISLRKQGKLEAVWSRFVQILALVGILSAGRSAQAGETEDTDGVETVIIGESAAKPKLDRDRARSEITRGDLERRLPRSAPDALRFEPGVFVQQTAHGQGSAFIRGLTGQQTLLLFDGIRLNNSTYRQGPNQYFFTLDAQSIDSIQLVRGGASSQFGSDAIGGVILARPIEPRLQAKDSGLSYQPRLKLQGATADDAFGGRVESHLAFNDTVAFYGGVGGRSVGLLEGGGVVRNPEDDGVPLVPRFAADGRTQLGTGFDELTADGRLVFRLSPTEQLKIATYVYRQFDAPRTDQCPAAFAPFDECLTYDEQFRTLSYLAYEARPDLTGLQTLRTTLSWQRQQERRTLGRPSSNVENLGRDVVDTVGVTIEARTKKWTIAPFWQIHLNYGADNYYDAIDSRAFISFSDIQVTEARSRGQYLDGSRYAYGGAFLQSNHALWDSLLEVKLGGRVSWIDASAPSDPDSGSSAVNQTWVPAVFNAGIKLRASNTLAVLFNVDRSFRTPNLDDLTSRQQTGPGFQFENANLDPESALTTEIGVRYRGLLQWELWAFRTSLDDALIKTPRPDSACPPNTPRCQASQTRFQLINAPDSSELLGVESSMYAFLPWRMEARATVAWTRGEGPNVGERPTDPAIPFQERVPLSRIPPLNGTLEVLWRSRWNVTLSGTVRWSTQQDRLALSDVADARIPRGGTPGFVVGDVRAIYRWKRVGALSVALENISDAAYRYHGSSVNGPARGVSVALDVAPWWL